MTSAWAALMTSYGFGAHGPYSRTPVPADYDPAAHLSPASVLMESVGDWRLVRSTLARGYYAVRPEHGRRLLRATSDEAAREEFHRIMKREGD